MTHKIAVLCTTLILALSPVDAEDSYSDVVERLLRSANFELTYSANQPKLTPGHFVQNFEEIARCEFKVYQDTKSVLKDFNGELYESVSAQTYIFHMKNIDPTTIREAGYRSFTLETTNKEQLVDFLYQEPGRFDERTKEPLVEIFYPNESMDQYREYFTELAGHCEEGLKE